MLTLTVYLGLLIEHLPFTDEVPWMAKFMCMLWWYSIGESGTTLNHITASVDHSCLECDTVHSGVFISQTLDALIFIVACLFLTYWTH